MMCFIQATWAKGAQEYLRSLLQNYSIKFKKSDLNRPPFCILRKCAHSGSLELIDLKKKKKKNTRQAYPSRVKVVAHVRLLTVLRNGDCS